MSPKFLDVVLLQLRLCLIIYNLISFEVGNAPSILFVLISSFLRFFIGLSPASENIVIIAMMIKKGGGLTVKRMFSNLRGCFNCLVWPVVVLSIRPFFLSTTIYVYSGSSSVNFLFKSRMKIVSNYL